jgi:hypothetical protein
MRPCQDTVIPVLGFTVCESKTCLLWSAACLAAVALFARRREVAHVTYSPLKYGNHVVYNSSRRRTVHTKAVITGQNRLAIIAVGDFAKVADPLTVGSCPRGTAVRFVLAATPVVNV